MNKPSYYAIIPAGVRYDKRLPNGAKLLYGEITALSNKEGFCWASNRYFADLYGIAVRTIQRWIAEMERGGHIRCTTKAGKRKIFISAKLPGMSELGVRNPGFLRQKCPGGGGQKCPHSITESNTRIGGFSSFPSLIGKSDREIRKAVN